MSVLVSFDFSTFTATDIAQIAGATGTALLAGITFAYVLATRAMVREMRQAREAQTRPYVVLDFDYPRTYLCYMVIKNIGNGAALDLRVTFEPDVEYQNSGMKLSQLPIFQETRFLVPGRELRFFYKSLQGQAPRAEEQAVVARVEYSNTAGATYTDEISLNPYLMSQLYFLEEKTFTHLVKAVQDVSKEIKSLQRETARLWQDSNAAWLASVPLVADSSVAAVKAKLLEVKTVWGIYSDESNEGYVSPKRFQQRFQRMAFDMAMLLSLAQSGEDKPSPKLAEGVVRVARDLYQIGTFQFYLGPETTEEFNRRGTALISTIEDILLHD